jgi:hypothetical protein
MLLAKRLNVPTSPNRKVAKPNPPPGRPLSPRIEKEKTARARVGAGHAKVLRVSKIRAPLDGMIPGGLRPVDHPLKLLRVFQQRATAKMAERELLACLSIHKDERHAGGEGIVQIYTWDPRILRRRGTRVVRQHVHVVAKEAKPEVNQQVGFKHIIGARGDVLVPCQRLARKTVGRQSRASSNGSKHSQGMLPEVGEAVTAKEVQLFRGVVVDARNSKTLPCKSFVPDLVWTLMTLVGTVHITGSRNAYFTTTGGVPLQPDGTPGDTIGPWQRPAPGTFGNAARNSLRGPAFFQADVSVAKNISLKESTSIQFRTDIFNLFNKVNLDNPIPCVDCQAGGIIVNTAFGGAALQRQIMLSLRMDF